MNIDDIKQLVELMVQNELSELDITDGENKVSLKRGGAPVITPIHVAAPAAAHAPAVSAVAPGEEAAATGEKLIEIRSPMVGTFYSSSSPDSDSYVSVGSVVGDDSVICIVEAMKVMNEIKAECSGTIAEVCVKNAQPVEYNQVLYRVRPS